MEIRCALLPPERMVEIIPALQRLDPRLASDLLAGRLAEMQQRGYLCVGIYDGDQLIGISGLWLLTKYYVGRHLEMDNVVIDEAYRSGGIGERLIAWVEDYARAAGCRAIELNVYVANQRGNRFWQRNGFVILGHHYQKILVKEGAEAGACLGAGAAGESGASRAIVRDKSLSIRSAVAGDAAAINDIYNHYVLHSTCTYQEEPETLDERRRWLAAHTGAHVVRVAVESDGTVVGWASLSAYHPRSAYRFTAENSIYLRHDRLGRGLGSQLLGDLITQARKGGFHSIIAGASADQQASVALHRRAGFVPVSHLRQVGFKFGQWLDVVYLQLPLEP